MSTDRSNGVSRRTLAKGAAWAVPAAAVAAAAPAYAVSGTVTFNNLNTACKLPGDSCKNDTGVTKGYVVAMEVCNTVTGNPGTITVTFPATVDGLLCGVGKTWTIKPNPLLITQSGCSIVYISLEGEPNSANCTISGQTTFTWSAQNGLTGSGILTFSAASTLPCSERLPGDTTGPSCFPVLPGNTPTPTTTTSTTAEVTTTTTTAEVTTTTTTAEVTTTTTTAEVTTTTTTAA